MKINILVVARWPLGGIRTYMKYVYSSFLGSYSITLLVPSTQEDAALKLDAEQLGIRLVVCPSGKGLAGLINGIFHELSCHRYQVIQSQGFISGLAVYPVNLFFHIPHILTVHGILEDKYLKGRFAWFKRAILAHVLCNIDVLYAVSNDMLVHLYEHFPSLKKAHCRKAVIPNGIDVSEFAGSRELLQPLRKSLGIGPDVFLFGFLGRYMQQKGFNYLINALQILEREETLDRKYHLLAVGSGDYLEHYKKIISEQGLSKRVTFIPFQGSVAGVYAELDAVVMPSVWEASGLLAMEALCMGVPLIASDCIGLRETVADTPAVVFQSENPDALANAMLCLMNNPQQETFLSFAPIAQQRYDVAHTAHELRSLIDGVVNA